MPNSSSSAYLFAFAALSLTACGGGGGGGGGGGNTVSPIAASVQATSPLITNVPTPTYTGEELIAFNTLNSEREQCGFGKLTQNAKLDVASTGHVDWLLLNNRYGHYQEVGTPGFTGIFPEDRIAAASYSPNVRFASTESSTTNIGDMAGQAEFLTRDLMNAPYHEIGMLRGFIDVGVSFKELKTPTNLVGRYVLNFDFGAKDSQGLQTASAGTVRTYPCQGSTGIRPALYAEEPSPVPGRNLLLNPLGTNIAVIGDAGKTIAITSATMFGPNSLPVPLRTAVTAWTDATGLLQANEAFISADVPLTANTIYTVSITGMNGGTAFSRNFSFTTAAN